MAIAFAATERFVVDLDVRKQAQTLAFTEAPLILGLILASPRDVIVVRVAVGVGAIVVFRRSELVKVIFNAGLFALQTAVAVVVFHVVLGDGIAVEPRGWLAGFLASSAFFVTSGVLVIGVMLLVSSEASIRSQAMVLAIGFAAALAGTAAALASASAVWSDGRSWILLAPICAAIGYFGLAYIRIRERHQALSHLNTYTTELATDHAITDLVRSIVDGTAELLNASRSILVLRRGDESVFYERQADAQMSTVVRSTSDGEWATALSVVRGTGVGWPGGMPVLGMTLDDTNVIVQEVPLADDSGLIVIDGRRSAARRFDAEDVQLLETAAGHAAAALLNAQLVEKLREEAAFRAHQALHDDVTDLPNQRALLEQLEGQLALGTRLVMLTARIHSLREVNETLGRAMGDEMLRQVASRLRPIGRRSWCARSGTDEFTLVVPGGQDESDELAERLVEAFDQPVLCHDVALAVTVGVGVALAPQHGTEADLLLRRASLAASRSALDGTSVTTWASDRDPYDPQSLTIAADLRDAIPDGELEVHFQPQLDIASGQIVSAEALVRWRHPRLGDLRPDQFIPADENTG
ncbi:MAG: diguanylate cyclase domain-containing protein, partial [Acidimicrobiales bacterium]